MGTRIADRDVLSKAITLLLKYPLCENCLGRLFGGLGRGLSNYERGRALKIVVLMDIYRRFIEGSMNKEEFITIASNIGSIAKQSVLELGFPISEDRSRCIICGFSSLEEKLVEWAQRIVKYIKEYNARSFLVGVVKGSSIEKREEELAREIELKYYENIRNEVKREVGKKVQELIDIKPNFTRPDVVLIVDIDNDAITVKPMPIYIKGRYWKLGRRISQAKWILWNGSKKYPLSIEEVLEPMGEIVGAKEVILHASGREDVDVRMLGTGRPFIVELKEPKTYNFDLKTLEEKANSVSRYVRFTLECETSRKDIRLIKIERARKTKVYKALIVVEKDLSEDELKRLEEYFRGRVIRQRTPRRVLHRRPDVERHRKVYNVKTKLITSNVFEALIECEGGLYVKELVSGDNGRTKPSFAEYLGAQAVCIELDVIAVYQ
ncbi:MAG TPA: tRNA pseudouridine(54/55) synthase Pus10 [Desulfurococcaceae archaeon]|nr:tRNA pseudouridine(54/55) synthase Pus10 [Desulfurococcaceae archaeon]